MHQTHIMHAKQKSNFLDFSLQLH